MYPQTDLSLLWIITCAFLVFMMQLGFALVETGCVRPKNTINVAMKNLVDSTFGFICFWIVGFGLMFGADKYGLFGTSSFFIDGSNTSENAMFFFQAMFATTAATIVSGAVAERMKFGSYVLTAIALTTLIYPIYGHWAWCDGGWLKELGFTDFAGSTVVHSVGAWVGLAGAIVLGPRLGKFRTKNFRDFSPSNFNFIVFGVFILWFAWFGFNAGSLMSFHADATTILCNTLIAGAAGGISAYCISLLANDKIGVELFSFGIIAGLVGVTAGCNAFTLQEAALVGFFAAIVMFFADKILLMLKIDDPLSVVSVHGVAGAWGTLAVGLFAYPPAGMDRMSFIGVQVTGIVTAFFFAFAAGLLFFMVLLYLGSLRVSKKHEVIGLNITEHHASAPWLRTIESIVHIMKSGNYDTKVHEEPGTEVGAVARFFNFLLDKLQSKQIELKKRNKNLHTQILVDPLTRALNRRGIMKNFEGVMESEEYSIILIDIDHFKQVNDTFGHNTGDIILQEFALLVKELIRENDIFGRWGGEEFILIVPTPNRIRAQQIAEKVRTAVKDFRFTEVEKITCSIGVCSNSDPASSFETILEYADKALYQAKDSGRDRVKSHRHIE